MENIRILWTGRHRSLDPDVAFQELRRIEEKYGGIEPAAVVLEAESNTSPLHGEFEWDNAKAAQRYRYEQARHLIRELVFLPVDNEGNPVGKFSEPLRAFHNVVEGDRQFYELTFKVLEEPEHRQQVIERLKREALSWRNRARDFEELTSIVRAIDQLAA